MRFQTLLLSLLSASPLAAQQLLWERSGIEGRIGFSPGFVANVGEVDKDECEDLLVLGYNFVTFHEELFLLSGRDGRTLRRLPQADPFRYARVAAAGDVDGDGTPDYLVTSQHHLGQQPNRVEVRSGRDDALLWKVERPSREAFGLGLLGNVDLDGDGRPDVVATSPYYWNGARYGAVFAYKNNGEPLWQLLGTPDLMPGLPPYWNAIGRIGDLDRDGGDDFVVGGVDGRAGAAGGLVLSGRTGALLVTGLAPPGIQVGDSCEGCGDLNADGVPDFAVGGPGLMFAFSGRDGHELYRWQETTLGQAIKSGGHDLDQDGVSDLVASASNFGRVFGLSGRDGSALVRIDQRPSGGAAGAFGISLAVLAPQPGNPFPLIAISDPRAHSTLYGPLGRISVYRAAPPSVQPLGEACTGTLTTAPRIGMTALGVLGASGARVHLSNAPPAAPAFLLIGFSKTSWNGIPLPLALDALGFPGCRLFTSIELIAGVTTGTDGNARGYASVDLPLPLAAQGPVSAYGQWLVLGQGQTWPGALSAALEWRH
jgi:hypothetical protein